MAKNPPEVGNEENTKQLVKKPQQKSVIKDADWDLENFMLDDGPEEDDY